MTEGSEWPNIPGFEVLEVIGGGAQGVVYRARQQSLQRIVAIKLLKARHSSNPEKVRGFLKEARLASKLQHPNILHGIDVGESEGRLFFVMEFVAGDDAWNVLRESGPFSEKDALDAVYQVGQALRHAAERGLVHGDIKPENLMIAHDGTIKVVDFGIARIMRYSKGEIEGTRGFMAPEIASGRSTGDIRSDLYSLGVTLRELLTGLDGGSGQDAFSRAPQPVSGATTAVIRRLMARDPKERFQSPQALLQALREIPGFDPDHVARAPAARVAPVKTRRRKRSSPIPAILLVVAVTVAVIILVIQAGSEPGGGTPSAPGKGGDPAASAGRGDEEAGPGTGGGADSEKGVPKHPLKTTTVATPETLPPSLSFEPSATETREGEILRVQLIAKHLKAGLDPVFKMYDSRGHEVDQSVALPSFGRDADSPDRVSVTWDVPWFKGNDPASYRLVASQGVLQVSLDVKVLPVNRPPALAAVAAKPVAVVEGGSPVVLNLASTDPDEDEVSLKIEHSIPGLTARLEGTVLRLEAEKQPGRQATEGVLVVVATDGHGGRDEMTIAVRVEDADHATEVELQAGKTWRAASQGDLHMVMGPSKIAFKVKLLLKDADNPERDRLRAELLPNPAPPRGARLKRLASGEFQLTWRPPTRGGWGPHEASVQIWEEGSKRAIHTVRMQSLRRIDTTKRAQGVVDKALEWMRGHQLWNGSMPVSEKEFLEACARHKGQCTGYGKGTYSVGITALCAIAALRAGDGSPWVHRLLEYVVSQQRDDGWFGAKTVPHNTYDHAIATEGVALGWHLLGDRRFREAARKGVLVLERIRAKLKESSGWRYTNTPGQSDTSVTIWAMRALYTARMAGVGVPDAAIRGGIDWLSQQARANGRVGYGSALELPARPKHLEGRFPATISESLTAGALSILLHDAAHRPPAALMEKGFALVDSCPPSWTLTGKVPNSLWSRLDRGQQEKPESISACDFYYWQHATAMYRKRQHEVRGYKIPKEWKRLADVLEQAQERKGPHKGSFAPIDPWSEDGGRVYSTAMLVLALANLEYGEPLVRE